MHHPDVAEDEATRDGADGIDRDPSSITEAYALLQSVIRESKSDALPAPAPEEPDVPEPAGSTRSSVLASHESSTIWVEAPPDETYQLLHDATSRLGGIGHVDRGLGLLEVIVRFEGGPSCSVLMTLQGRSHGTDVFCEMESIEAAPTPSIEPVLDAIVELLGA